MLLLRRDILSTDLLYFRTSSPNIDLEISRAYSSYPDIIRNLDGSVPRYRVLRSLQCFCFSFLLFDTCIEFILFCFICFSIFFSFEIHYLHPVSTDTTRFRCQPRIAPTWHPSPKTRIFQQRVQLILDALEIVDDGEMRAADSTIVIHGTLDQFKARNTVALLGICWISTALTPTMTPGRRKKRKKRPKKWDKSPSSSIEFQKLPGPSQPRRNRALSCLQRPGPMELFATSFSGHGLLPSKA